MNYLETLGQLPDNKKLPFFLQLCTKPAAVQETVLMNIIRENAHCEFGRKFHFETIKTVSDYRARVPVTGWGTYREASERMQKGEADILFQGAPEYFILTSGTTGAEKRLPESGRGKEAKYMVGQLRNLHLVFSRPELLEGKFLPLSNQATVGVTESGIPYGAASGLTTKNSSPEFLKLNACPLAVKEIPDPVSSDYATMRFAAAEDVRIIVGNNAGRIASLISIAEENARQIVEDIQRGTLSTKFDIPGKIREKLEPYLTPNPEKAEFFKGKLKNGDRFLPPLFWPNLRIIRCWLAGSVGRYVEKAKSLLSGYEHEISFVDAGYGASEGKFNIPLDNGSASGPLALFSGFYEFVPVEDETDETILLSHELEDGKEYRILLTTWSGLYRYNLKDIIIVNGFTGATPNIEFVSKTRDIGNLCGEKLSSSFLTKVCTKAFAACGIEWTHFGAVADKERGRYFICIEPSRPGVALGPLKNEIEKQLTQKNTVYRVFREQQMIAGVQVIEMKKGWQQMLYAEKIRPGLSISQVKLPVIYPELPAEKWIENRELTDD